jgi:tetratricopeptide (TPR) repeat protein
LNITTAEGGKKMAHKKSGTPRKKAAKKRRSKKGQKSAAADAPPPLRDARLMEKMMADMGRLLEEQEFESAEEANAFLQQFIGVKELPKPAADLTILDQAQEKIYEAMEASGKRRVRLAREALEISPDCADAYVLLADETAQTPEEARDLYEQGVRAGERALGAEAFEELAGDFWGILETRPYMRARAGLAECLEALGEREQAIGHYRELLRLNPHDNQGNRYLLSHLLLKESMDDALGELLSQYEDDAMAEWVYTRALWKFRRRGDDAEAREALKEAFEQNPFVPLYLMGLKKLPRRPPEYIGFGDENEAVSYFANAAEDWLETPGALEWLANTMLESLQEMGEDQSAQKEKPIPFKRR